MQPAALDWLQTIEWVQPDEELKEAFKRVLQNPTFDQAKRIGLCPLGNMTDSASRIAYDLRNFTDEYFPERTIAIMPLNEALATKMDAYVLYDDNINSGLQALNILAGWLGAKLPDQLLLQEDHVQPLDRTLQEELKRKPLALTFAVGIEGSIEALKDNLCKELRLERSKLVAVASKIQLDRRKCLNGPDSSFQHSSKLALKDFVREVSKQILVSEGRSSEVAESRVFGYRGAEAMIVFPYNCPTMTVTCLWISGAWSGGTWLPLVERSRRTDTVGSLVGEDV